MADLKKREGYAGWYQGLNAQLTKTVVASAIGLSIKEKSFRASQLLVAAFSKHDYDIYIYMNLSIRRARLSERLRRRMENEQMGQLEWMGRGFPILDV